MKKALLVLLVSFNLLENNYIFNNTIYEDTLNNENFTIINNTSNYDNIITQKSEIKNVIYNNLNNRSEATILYCVYDNCLNDFYDVYNNRELMSSINNYLNPYNKFSSISYRININNSYTKIKLNVNRKYSDNQIVELDKEIDNFLNKLDLNKMSDLEKIKWAHDYIVKRNKYDKVSAKKGYGDAYSAYGAIIGNKAICLGYAEAVSVLLNKLNIQNIMISNNTHIWNLVKVNNKWLHLDATWDDPIYKNGKQVLKHDYFLVTSKELEKLDNSDNHKYNVDYYLESLMN